MNKIFAGIEILRPLNMLLCLLAVIISAFLIEGIASPLLPYAILVVICFAGASNILNDVLDVQIDKTNSPDRVLASGRLSILDALIIMSALYSIGIVSTTYLQHVGKLIALAFVLPFLVLYTPLFKRLPLIGNVMVGSILGLVFLFTEGAIHGSIDKMWIPFYLATGLSTIRELVKDLVDMEGDAIAGLHTFPIKFGFAATLWLLRICTICFCFTAMIPWFEGWYGIYYLILLIGGVIFPILYAVFILLNENSNVEAYIKTARILKGTTIAGMIVILSSGI